MEHSRGATAAVDSASRSRASFWIRADALMRKSLVVQRRSWGTNGCLVTFPAFLCLLLFGIQLIVDTLMSKPEFTCGCRCVPVANSSCEQRCGLGYSDNIQAPTCAVTSPYQLPAMLQVPNRRFQAVNLRGEFPGFPEPSCRSSNNCPFVFLYTGLNRSIAHEVMSNLLSRGVPPDPMRQLVLGTYQRPPIAYFTEPGLRHIFFFVERNCTNFWLPMAACVPTRMLWRNTTSIIAKELYKGYRKANQGHVTNGIPLAFDFHNTSSTKLQVTVFYNATFAGDIRMDMEPGIVRVARSLNLVAQAFLRLTLNMHAELPLSFIKEMPKPQTKYTLDFSSLLGPLFYMWVLQLVLPVMLTSLVYEKERHIRTMMKIHGLGDGPYWLVTYGYFLLLSLVYVFCFVLFGSAVGLEFFRKNDYSIQFVFFFIYLNLQITLAFLGAAFFSRVVTARVCGYLYVFAFGLLGSYLFHNLIEDSGTTRGQVFALELLPGFSLYRGLYEFAQYAIASGKKGTIGMRWRDLNADENGMKQVVGIMSVEWALFMSLAMYLDQVVAIGDGLKKHPLFFLGRTRSQTRGNLEESDLTPDRDVLQERGIVEGWRHVRDGRFSLVCDNLLKIYSGEDETCGKVAVRGLSLAVHHGECFGVLGPNGAGKSTSICMMVGFLRPSAGKVFVQGLDIHNDMDKLYTVLGVCPQQDLLWEALTGREHLLFYGRLKNLRGAELESAVRASLDRVNLFKGGVGNKPAGTYSGGMKRRLSVAISLVGDPKVVFMDEPSTGLDPASRRTLWDVIRQAKQNRAIVLTTHSMEEAEALCDRVGILVEGRLNCLGSSKDLKARYGGTFKFTITASAVKELEVAAMVSAWSSTATCIYKLCGTHKFELRKEEVDMARIFRDVENAKESLGVQAWGLTDTTLEDVFLKVVGQ